MIIQTLFLENADEPLHMRLFLGRLRSCPIPDDMILKKKRFDALHVAPYMVTLLLIFTTAILFLKCFMFFFRAAFAFWLGGVREVNGRSFRKRGYGVDGAMFFTKQIYVFHVEFNELPYAVRF
jgi:hypothetical protein